MQVWNRTALVEEPEVGAVAIRFAYGTVPGRFLAKTILCRKPVTRLYAAWQKSPLSRGKVEKFLARFKIDVSDCTEQEFHDFNAFFHPAEKMLCKPNSRP